MASPGERRTPPEVDRAAASRAAVDARRARAAVKAEIANGTRTAVEVIDEAATAPGSASGRLRVAEFLTSVPAIGVTKRDRIMAEVGISDSRRLGGLGRHQRERLRDLLDARARRSPVGPSLVVLAGPTAVGKGTVAGYIRDHHPEALLSVSATTRAPRPGEVEGVSYYFVDDDEFDRMIADGDLLEWAVVHNAFRYGTPRKPIEEAIAANRSVLLEIDIQGARQVRAAMPGARLVFLMPPSWEELVRRLIGRGTESPEEQQRRLETARVELAARSEFDEIVVNDDVARAAQHVVDLMKTTPAARRS